MYKVGEKMKVGLMGFEFGSPNKGCEALGYSFINILNKIVEEKLIIYNFTNLSLGYFPEVYRDIEFKKAPLKIKDLSFSTFRAMKECDFIFDVTLGDSFSDIYSKDHLMNNLKFKEMAILSGTPYISLPQTYGPFYNKVVRALSKHVLKKSNTVFSRDTTSAEYVNELTGREVIDCTDMAFALPFTRTDVSNGSVMNIGINVSGLLWRGGFNRTNHFGLTVDYKKFTTEIINQLRAKDNCKIHLIPHVIDLKENAYDDDYKVCAELADDYSGIIIPQPFKTPIEAKSYISNMDVFVGARMHSAIGAFSACVPTIPFSYSRKFEGLFESLQYPFVIHGCCITTEEAIEQTLKWIDERAVLKNSVMDSMKIVNEKITNFEIHLANILK